MDLLRKETTKWRLAGLAAVGAVLAWTWACTKANPDYDPNAYCEVGERTCAGPGTALLCTSAHEWPAPDSGSPWVTDCWAGTECMEGRCVASQQATPCTTQKDCGAGEICTIVLTGGEPPAVGTYCVPEPFPDGFGPGVACNMGSECRSGRCTRRVCYEACETDEDCTNSQQVCRPLNVTIDGLRFDGQVQGCVPPK